MKSLLGKRKTSSSTRKFNAGWQVLADEMTGYFVEDCYWIFWKKEEWTIRVAFKVGQEKDIRNIGYLFGRD